MPLGGSTKDILARNRTADMFTASSPHSYFDQPPAYGPRETRAVPAIMRPMLARVRMFIPKRMPSVSIAPLPRLCSGPDHEADPIRSWRIAAPTMAGLVPAWCAPKRHGSLLSRRRKVKRETARGRNPTRQNRRTTGLSLSAAEGPAVAACSRAQQPLH